MYKIIKQIMADILRNKIMLSYTALLAIASLSIFSLEDTSSKGILSMLNVLLMIVPLFCLLFSTIYIYNSSEFIELLLSQPIPRKSIWRSLYIGLSLAMSLAFIAGSGIWILFFQADYLGFMLILIGLLLTLGFSSLAFLAALLAKDKAKGIGISIFCWLFFAILYDGIVLFILFQFSDYPIEKLMIFISFLNPIDLARILLLMQLDVSALMGYTGAIFKDFFGTQLGIIISYLCLSMWILVPFKISENIFSKKDL